MCGIAGILQYDGGTPSLELLAKMTDSIVHRGPDDAGMWHEDGIGLGFRRLSIIDLAEGHQPLCNEDGSVWIVFNGEIYNYKELREMLTAKGHQWKTNADTEVIVHLYEEYGEQCVGHLRGMFAFAIWDRKKRQLFGARDYFGIKPFYYVNTAEQFLFASEIKALLQSGDVQRSVDVQAFLNYLTFQYVPEPMTMFANIRKLPPAHTITVTADGRMAISKYWDPAFSPLDRPFDDIVEELRARLADSVQYHMQSDVMRGCFLSSGVDSTAIAAHMRQIEPIKTFSVGFAGPLNENVYAQATAEALGTEHYSKIINRDEFVASLPKAVWHMDEPVADPSAIALYHLAKLAREQVTVVLSGEGADELFGGYRIYREPLALKPMAWLPPALKKALNGWLRKLPTFPGKNYLLRGTTPLEERFLGNAKIFTDDVKAEIVRLDAETLDNCSSPFEIARTFYDRTRGLDDVTRMQYIDLNLWLPGDILMKADKMTMAHSLELRVPFLDKELFETARQIPWSYRIAKGTTKYVLRKAAEGIVPDFILHRPKLGFPVPIRDWLKEDGSWMWEMIRSGGIEDFIRLQAVEQMLIRHRSGQGDYSRRLWVVLIFALWHSAFMQEAGLNSSKPFPQVS